MRKLENSELNRKSIDDFKEASKTPLIIILDDIRSLNDNDIVCTTVYLDFVQFLCKGHCLSFLKNQQRLSVITGTL